MGHHSPPRVALKTLGCKVNQYDSQEIREAFEQAGYVLVPFEEAADVYVINSCTVTGEADKDARKLARNAKRRSPGALVVMTGCYAATRADEVGAIPEVDLVVPRTGTGPLCVPDHDPQAVLVACVQGRKEGLSRFPGHTRAFVKVQDGCDSRCAYCVVPLARGPSRSRPLPEALAQVTQFARAGHREVVLVGVHLGMYGQDFAPPVTLAELVRQCLRVEGLGRLRLSSLEPREVTDELVELIAEHAPQPGQPGPFLCRHLHLPLQSGDDEVLRRMGRPYDAAVFAELVCRVAGRIPGVALGADVMVGFPGETDEAFANTVQLIEALPLTYLHVFSYSRRPGTDRKSVV
jgi:threonylcarbamoyladenosine tRNA methylthiotransferase MtaB